MLDLKFLHVPVGEAPLLAVLYQDLKQARHVRTYRVSFKDKVPPPPDPSRALCSANAPLYRHVVHVCRVLTCSHAGHCICALKRGAVKRVAHILAVLSQTMLAHQA